MNFWVYHYPFSVWGLKPTVNTNTDPKLQSQRQRLEPNQPTLNGLP
jgi:hypothetical protein